MDENTRNITNFLIKSEDEKREPEKEWDRTNIMLPILYMHDYTKTLHSSEALTNNDIHV